MVVIHIFVEAGESIYIFLDMLFLLTTAMVAMAARPLLQQAINGLDGHGDGAHNVEHVEYGDERGDG